MFACFIRITENPEIRISELPEIRDSRIPEIRIFGNSGFTSCLDRWANPEVREAGYMVIGVVQIRSQSHLELVQMPALGRRCTLVYSGCPTGALSSK